MCMQLLPIVLFSSSSSCHKCCCEALAFHISSLYRALLFVGDAEARSMVELRRSASTYVAVGGLLLFGTITSLLAKIGECPL